MKWGTLPEEMTRRHEDAMSKEPKQKPELPTPIRFHYVKSNFFRVIHVDGAFGGLSPRGLIEMAVFNERLPIPTLTVQPLKEDQTLGDELRDARVSRDGIFRELEANLVFDVETAKILVDWLQDKIKQLEHLSRSKSTGSQASE
jgi:hypothetical protein